MVIVSFVFVNRKNRKNTENFTPDMLENNLLSDGSFSNGNNLNEFLEKKGKNNIIIFPNNGQSSYVLRLSKDKKLSEDSSIYYKIQVNLKPNSLYYLGCLYYSPSNKQLYHRINFPNESPLILKTLNDNKYTKPNNSNFNYKYTLFRTPNTDSNINITIDLLFGFNDLDGHQYITDIGLFQILENNGIPITENLRCYFNAYNPESIVNYRTTIKDLSGSGNDFTASRSRGVKRSSLNLTDNKLVGPNSFILQNEGNVKLNSKFSIFILVKTTTISPKNTYESFNNKTYEEEDIIVPNNDVSGDVLLQIPGNQGYALKIYYPDKYGKIFITAGNQSFQTYIKFLSFLSAMLALTYDGQSIKLYLNEEIILETPCPEIYFNNDNIVINPDGTFSGNLYAFAFYNSFLESHQVNLISRYFNKMKAIGKELSSFSAKEIENISNLIESPKNIRKKIKNNIPEEESTQEENCPKVIFEDNHYYVIIPRDSELCKKIGYYGIRDYGTNIDTAKQIYQTNFPNCSVPDILNKNKYKGDLLNCPFIMMTPDNPCTQFDCRNIDWKKGTVKNKNCKKSIDYYCSKYADMDPACYCWKKENREKDECLKWRGKFESEDKCDFRKHNIEKHPDFKNYIKKNNIPCWGCNLDAPESTGDYSSRKGSGAR